MAKAQRKADSARTLSALPPSASVPPVPAPAPPLPPPAPDSAPSFSEPHIRPTWHTMAGKKAGKGPAIVRRFGEVVRAARLYRGLSQEDLAFHARLHTSHISLIETGRRDTRVSTICALAFGLKMNPADIMPRIFPESHAPRAVSSRG